VETEAVVKPLAIFNPPQRRILLFLDGNAPARARVVQESTGIAPHTLHASLGRLEANSLVQRPFGGADYVLTDTGVEAVAKLREMDNAQRTHGDDRPDEAGTEDHDQL
jgi:DNA-binding MarR family transcriptional regulator